MSIVFDNSSDRLLITSNIPAWTHPNSLTMMGWFRYAAGTGGLQTMFARIRDDVSAYEFVGLLSGGALYYEDSNGNNITGSTLSTNTWYHVAWTISITGTATLYLDGVSAGTTSGAAKAGSPERLETGGWRSTNGNRWNGDISALKAWTRILNSTDIGTEKDFAEVQDATSVYGAWYLQTATDYLDQTGNLNHFTAGGTLTDSSNPPGVTFPSAGTTISRAMTMGFG